MSEKKADYTLSLDNLNPPQREAVKHHLGPIIILAGAGTGKTRVLTHRVVNLIRQHRVFPDRILAVTFTNKAAGEMRERLHSMLGAEADRVWISTFHSAGLRILRRNADRLGYSNDFTVYDDQDSTALMRRLLKQMSIADKQNPPGVFLRFIDAAKNRLERPQDIPLNGVGYNYRLKVEVYDKYQLELHKAKAMDFGDLLTNTVYLLKENPDILKDYQRQLQFILVDEFQDTNPAQYELVRLLTGAHRNLLVVGDDDQSIYAFRGATIEHIRGFDQDFPDAKVVKLEQNYRSTGNILAASHGVIEKSQGRKSKKLWTSSNNGEPIVCISADDEYDEAEYIVKEILNLKAGGTALSDIAVFYRTNAQSRVLEDALMRHQVPYRIFGGLRFYDRKEIKDIIAYLRILINPADAEALLRIINVPARGIGAQTLGQVLDHAAKNAQTVWESVVAASSRSAPLKRFVTIIEGIKSGIDSRAVGEIIAEVLDKSGYEASLKASDDLSSESRLENLSELRSSAISNGIGLDALRGFLDKVALATSADSPKESDGFAENPEEHRQEFVALMTLHLAKGLEFTNVFFTGFEEGLVPHYRSIDEGDVDEERRLCYVGMTRAREKLYLTRCDWRGMFSSGGGGSRYVSRFGYDIPDGLIHNLVGRFTYLSDCNEDSIEMDDSIHRGPGVRGTFGRGTFAYTRGANDRRSAELHSENSTETDLSRDSDSNVIKFRALSQFGARVKYLGAQVGESLEPNDLSVELDHNVKGHNDSSETHEPDPPFTRVSRQRLKDTPSRLQYGGTCRSINEGNKIDRVAGLIRTADQLQDPQAQTNQKQYGKAEGDIIAGISEDDRNNQDNLEFCAPASGGILIPLTELKPGIKVRHHIFGIGEVLGIENAREPEQSKISISFQNGEETVRKRLVFKYAKLRNA